MTNKSDSDFYKVSLLIAVAMIIGLIWLNVSKSSDQGDVRCTVDYKLEYGDDDCSSYIESMQYEEDMKDCGFKPTC